MYAWDYNIQEFSQSSLKDLFYWTGGTLLAAAYLYHRKSLDLDFFSDAPVPHDTLIAFVSGLKKDAHLERVEEKKIHDALE